MKETRIGRALRKLFNALPYKLWRDEIGTFVARLPQILPSFGSPIQNDSLQLLQNQSLPAVATTTKTLSGITPTFSKGYVRVKIYGGATASAIITQVLVIVTDGTTFVLVGAYSPAVTTGTALSTSAASGSPYTNGGTLGTNVGGIDLLFPFEVDINCNQVSVLATTSVATATAVEDLEVSVTV